MAIGRLTDGDRHAGHMLVGGYIWRDYRRARVEGDRRAATTVARSTWECVLVEGVEVIRNFVT